LWQLRHSGHAPPMKLLLKGSFARTVRDAASRL
jgi:hypothetical protein